MSGSGDEDMHLEPGVEDDRSPGQRYEFRKSLVLGVVALVGGVALLILGLTTGKDIVLPVVAVVGGIAVLTFDAVTAQRRRNRRR